MVMHKLVGGGQYINLFIRDDRLTNEIRKGGMLTL